MTHLSLRDCLSDSAPISRPRLVALFTLLLAANALAWLWAWTAFATRPELLGTALLAWMFGLRHAMDADHIAAIDNVVRKLMQEGKRPLLAGGFFSLGHSTVVALASAAIAVSAAGMQGRFALLRGFGGLVGTLISASFLLLIALLNVVILCGLLRRLRVVSHGGAVDAVGLDALLAGRGLLARLLRPVVRVIRRSWHMFPLGMLFGLGFDTVTEVGLLGLSASQATQGLSPLQVMVFPALFTVAMVLVDSTDSALMVGAYGWALAQPLRKLWYNVTVTAGSAAVAVLIGGLEVLGLLAGRFGPSSGAWATLAAWGNDLTVPGCAIVAAFLLTWALSAGLYRWRRGRPAEATLPLE